VVNFKRESLAEEHKNKKKTVKKKDDLRVPQEKIQAFFLEGVAPRRKGTARRRRKVKIIEVSVISEELMITNRRIEGKEGARR